MNSKHLLLLLLMLGLFACNNTAQKGTTTQATTEEQNEEAVATDEATESVEEIVAAADEATEDGEETTAAADEAAEGSEETTAKADEAAEGDEETTAKADEAAEGSEETTAKADEAADETIAENENDAAIEAARKEALKGAPQGIEFLKVGAAAPMTSKKLKDISGKDLSVEDVKGDKGLLVMFSCNTCPYVIGWEDRYTELAKMCEENGIGMMTVNSNEAKRDNDDSFEAMKTHAKEKNYTFAYVVDDNSEMAKAYGATRTPDVFLFDKDLNLVYQGAIDDNMKDASKVTKPYLKNAIQSMLDGKEINPAKTKSIGCTIKWKKA